MASQPTPNTPNGVPEDLYRNPDHSQELSAKEIQIWLKVIRKRVKSIDVLTRPDADQPDEKTEPKRAPGIYGADMF